MEEFVCKHCGAPLKRKTSKFCSACGGKQDPVEDRGIPPLKEAEASLEKPPFMEENDVVPEVDHLLEGFVFEAPKEPFEGPHKLGLREWSKKEQKEQQMLVEVDSFLKDLSKPFLDGFKVVFYGEPGGTQKEKYILKVAKELFENKKISEEEPIVLNFGSFPEILDPKRLYVLQDIQSAARNLFNMEDFSDEASREQYRYKKILNQIIGLPRNIFLLINADISEKRAFFTLDARLPYVFEQVFQFPSLTNDQVYDRFLYYLPERQKKQIDPSFEEDFNSFVTKNRRFFPFQNEELAKYIANFSAKNEEITLPPEKFNSKSLEEAFADIIGMESIKREIRGLRNYLLIRNQLEQEGIKMPDFNLHMMFTGNPGTGKQLRLEEKILTPSGWVQNKDLKVGDEIISGRGLIEKVEGVFPQPKEMFYEIYFDDGSIAESSGNHLWRVQKRENNGTFSPYRVLALDDFRENVLDEKNQPVYCIDYVPPVHYEEKNLPFHPYVVGVLLAVEVTPGENIGALNSEILSRLSEYLPGEESLFSKIEKAYLFLREEMQKAEMERGGIFPLEYLLSSILQRTLLLQGVFDVGGFPVSEWITYYCEEGAFHEDLSFLIRSLGGKVKRQGNGLLSEFPIEYAHFCFLDKGKIAKYFPRKHKKDFKRYIRFVQRTEEVAGQCIKVSGPDHTFVMKDHIITHNTTVARIIAKLLFDMGYSREDKLIEVTSKDLVGAYGNQTGMKTNRAIMNAMGGVLFIDEAYALSNSCGAAGDEVIANIVKAMEDYKGDLVCMFAGYALEMQEFVESNSGIESRLAYTFKIEDYKEDELFDIFVLKLGKTGMRLSDEAKTPLRELLRFGVARRNFGNGRFVDKVMQKMLTRHATHVREHPEDLMIVSDNSIPTLPEVLSS